MAAYKKIAKEIRLKTLDMIFAAGSSHIGSNFSSIDILTVLFEKMDLEKDKLIVSKGWIAACTYAFLARKGVIDAQDLERYCMPGEEEYIGLIEPMGKFGLEAAGGAVGYGLSFGVGFALAKKMKKEEGTVYVLMSDGEMDVGMVWESALIAAHHNLDNLVAIVDNNRFQATGSTDKVLNLENLGDKWAAFEWDTMSVDGHDFKMIEDALENDGYDFEYPTIIIANTIKGKGVSFMEDRLSWHYRCPDEEEYNLAKEEICNGK